MEKNSMNILQTFSFCVPPQKKKKSYMGLEQHEGEWMMTDFSFFGFYKF